MRNQNGIATFAIALKSKRKGKTSSLLNHVDKKSNRTESSS